VAQEDLLLLQGLARVEHGLHQAGADDTRRIGPAEPDDTKEVGADGAEEQSAIRNAPSPVARRQSVGMRVLPNSQQMERALTIGVRSGFAPLDGLRLGQRPMEQGDAHVGRDDDIPRTRPRSRRKGAGPADPRQLPGGAHQIAAKGPACEALMLRYFGNEGDLGLFGPADQEDLQWLATNLAAWNDVAAAEVIDRYLVVKRESRAVDATAVGQWLAAHANDPQAVVDCMSVEPSQEIAIIKLLSRAGSQKLVFLATWRLWQRQVVLKRLLPPAEEAARIIARESQTHPLSLSHPNIIETFLLQNTSGEVFLVEEYLPVMLSDDYRAQGVEEAANLLFDIANALTYLHDTLALVHGDVKPENIGKRRENYVLLDFGICRARDQFIAATPTGSLRTRAPELLLDDKYADPNKVDVWALAATVFNAFAGRFPLLDPGESPPRASNAKDRTAFTDLLAERARLEYESRVDLQLVPDPLRDLLGRGLALKPSIRASAKDLRDAAQTTLAPYLRASDSALGATFSPRKEVAQYEVQFGPHPERLRFMPLPTKQAFRARLSSLAGFPYLDRGQIDFVRRLLKQLSD
jgi:hypothetical protein